MSFHKTDTIMKKDEKDYLPQSETEWLSTGKFTVEIATVSQSRIRCALTRGREGDRLVIMVGGIPRDPTRRQKLPLINKLYGHLAIKLLDHGMSSLLYNQPATGGSSGDWEKETLRSRAKTLEGIATHFSEQTSASDIALIGTSAGAYMALSAIEKIQSEGCKVSRLVLLSPAAYPEEIETVPYGEAFTTLIRTPWDVATSPVFPRLKKFISARGSLLVSFFEADTPPLPEYVQEYYRDFVRQLRTEGYDVTMLTIPGVAHNFRRIGVAEKKNVVDNDSIRATAKKLSEFLV